MRMRPSPPVAPLDTSSVQVPPPFRCPISLELMRDPVTVSTGQTYDRSSIEQWIAAGNSTCPITRLPLLPSLLIPNHTLRRLIQSWSSDSPSTASANSASAPPRNPPSPSLIHSLVSSLLPPSPSSSLPLSRLRSLISASSEKNRSLIILLSSSPALRPSLISLIFSDFHQELAADALAILSALPLSEFDADTISGRPDCIHRFADIICRHQSPETRIDAVAVIENVITATRDSEIRAAIGEGVVAGVVEIFRRPRAGTRAVKVGVKALFSICLTKQNRERAVEEGAAGVVVDRLAEIVDRCDAERALATIELLCRTQAGLLAFVSHSQVIPVLVKMILKVSERATEYAAGALLAVCNASEDRQQDAVDAGAVTQLLLLVQSDCTERAKRKAQLLLKLLWNAWPDQPVGLNSDLGLSDLLPF